MSDTQTLEDELNRLKREHADALQGYAELVALVKQLLNDKGDDEDNQPGDTDSLSDLKQKTDEFKRWTASLAKKGSEDIDKLEERIVRNPLLTVAISFGVGYLIARLLGLGGGRR